MSNTPLQKVLAVFHHNLLVRYQGGQTDAKSPFFHHGDESAKWKLNTWFADNFKRTLKKLFLYEWHEPIQENKWKLNASSADIFKKNNKNDFCKNDINQPVKQMEIECFIWLKVNLGLEKRNCNK